MEEINNINIENIIENKIDDHAQKLILGEFLQAIEQLEKLKTSSEKLV